MNRIALTFLAALTAIALQACGNIPSAYRGHFEDDSGVKLDVYQNSVRLEIEGKLILGEAHPITYEQLLEGKPGFYIDLKNENDTLSDVYWVTPHLETRIEAAGLIFYTTDIVYLQIDLKQSERVHSIHLLHADMGVMMLDRAQKSWHAGWPPFSRECTLLRK